MLQGWAQKSNVLFNQATEAYNKGNYQEAVDNYIAILKNNEHSATLYYNLGNAYYKLNAIPESIYYYEKSLLLDPNDQEVRTNLAYAQNMTLDAIDVLPQSGFSKLYKGVTSKLTFDQWAYASIFSMALFVILYIAFYYFQYASKKRLAFIGSILALVFSLLFIVFASIEWNTFKTDNPAIIFSNEIAVNAEPNEASGEVFVLHAGTKVNVLDSLNNYMKIRLTDGQVGWIPSKEIKLLKKF